MLRGERLDYACDVACKTSQRSHTMSMRLRRKSEKNERISTHDGHSHGNPQAQRQNASLSETNPINVQERVSSSLCEFLLYIGLSRRCLEVYRLLYTTVYACLKNSNKQALRINNINSSVWCENKTWKRASVK